MKALRDESDAMEDCLHCVFSGSNTEHEIT